MIEPFRHLIDMSILGFQNQIHKKDYAFSRDGIVVLSNELKKKYIDTLTVILDKKRDYKARAGIRRFNAYQRMKETTIMKMECINLKEYIMDRKKKFVQLSCISLSFLKKYD